MSADRMTGTKRGAAGTTLMEVLVTLLVVAFGLLGIGGLAMRMQLSDMESYQRAQALVLLDDMANRIAANRDQATSYVTTSPLGSGMTCPTTTSAGTLEQIDTLEWCTALQGAAEKLGSAKTGAMIGARGCIENINAAAQEYLITISWQGITPTAAPPTQVDCGAGLYDNAAAGCTADQCRRVVTTVVNIATLN